MSSDRQLVAECLAGEAQAFARLVDRYRSPVYGICLGQTKDFDAAEDAAQEAFIASYLGLGRLPDPDAFGPWLKRIAVNQCRMWRRRQRRLVRLGPEAEAEVPDPAPSAEEALVKQEQRRVVMNAIAKLSEPQQQAVVLFYLKELTLQQVAGFLEVAPQTVEQRLYRARRKLKQEMVNMVSETLGEAELPEEFTEKVVAEALEQGERLLAEKDWEAARSSFGRIAEALPDHAKAHRGLGLALAGSVDTALRAPEVFDNQERVRETFNSLERAYQLGSADDQVVLALSGLYQRFGRHREGGEFLEAEASRRGEWLQRVRLLGRAIALYYHAHYTGDSSNMEACVRCHRHMRELLPDDMEPRRRLDVWRPGGLCLAYAHTGDSQEVFDALDTLRDALAGEWSVYDHFSYSLAYQNQYRETGQWEALAAKGHEFADWARELPANDQRLVMAPLVLSGETDTVERNKVGEWVRFWTMLYTLNGTIQAEVEAEADTARTFDEIEAALERHERYRGSAADPESAAQSQERLAGNYLIGGTAAYRSGRYAKAVEFLERAEGLLGGLGAGPEPLYAAASHSALGQKQEAMSFLRKLDNRRIAIGIGRTEFAACRELDAMREDADVVELVASWERAEGVAPEGG